MKKKSIEKDSENGFKLANLPWNKSAMGDKEQTRQKIFRRLQRNTTKRTGFRNIHRKLTAAAAVLAVLVVFSVYFLQKNKFGPIPDTPKYAGTPLKDTVTPGGNKARLVLGDGSVLVLEEEENGTIGKEGNVLINKNERQLVYSGTATPPNERTSGDQVVYNLVSTPRGGQFQVVLPDGSKVWLNAASSLRFPTAFAGSERQVTLSGEAYFEISPDEHKPFRVKTGDMEVEVLGTHFNIQAYGDERDVQTTLLEGSVTINTPQDQVLLVPGEAASLHKANGNIRVKTTDAEAAVAWKNGYFQFNNEHLHSIMRKISRWYDVDIIYETDFPEKNFTGTISRYKQVEDVLGMLELTEVIHFRMEERRIIVMP